jgi:endo-1,4-beta-D-glucanase Y
MTPAAGPDWRKHQWREHGLDNRGSGGSGQAGLARRALLGGLAAATMLAPVAVRAAPGGAGQVPRDLMAPDEAAEWRAFRTRFIQQDGRVLDTGNGGQSHSEGQGWALLFAQRCDDREGFARVLDWTNRVLRRPDDALFAWHVRPGPAAVVDDPNNATDADLTIAWALLEAGRRWNVSAYRAQGRAIASDVLRLLVRESGGRRVLIPGLRGFEERDGLVLNPSYYVFPALGVLAESVPDPAWVELAADGLELLREAAFGRWRLVPDWLSLPHQQGAAPRPARGRPPRFSYDAVRVPLYLVWAGLAQEPAVAACGGFWGDPAQHLPPAWADLTNDTVSPLQAPTGMLAIARLVQAGRAGGGDLAGLPTVAMAPDYYSAALSLLSRMAWRDAGLLPA